MVILMRFSFLYIMCTQRVQTKRQTKFRFDISIRNTCFMPNENDVKKHTHLG